MMETHKTSRRAVTHEHNMNDKLFIPSAVSHEQIEIIIGALYMTLVDTLQHIGKAESQAFASAFKSELVTALKRGDISMSLLDDAAAYKFVVSLIERIEISRA
jgi:hypothetical protein